MKQCLICKAIKPLSDFHRQASRPSGLGDWCKPCKSERKRASYRANPEKHLLTAAKYRTENADKVAAAKRKCYQAKREQYLAKCKARYLEKRETILKTNAEYRRNNKAEKAKRDRKYVRARMDSDPLFRLTYTVRNRIFQAFRDRGFGKHSKTREMLGCDWETVKTHIELQFKPGMRWENRSEWHIDHIIPLASAKDEEQMIALCHYTNLQPLWAAENIAKGARLQPKKMVA